MKTLAKLTSLAALILGPAMAAPVINAIVNAASYARPGMPNAAVAQGSMFVVFGTELGPAQLQQAVGSPLLTSLGGTSIRVTVGTTMVDALLIYSYATQVAAILPSNTPAGIGLLAVTYNGRTSQSGAFRVLRSAPGILTQNQAGTGPALAQNFNSDADQPRNTITNSARPGQIVTLWATGLGPIAGSDAMVPTPQDLDLNLQVLVGGRSAVVRYKGRSGCCAGVDQIVFEVPRDVEGCHVPVVVTAGAAISNFTTMSIAAAGGACTDLNGISGAALARLDSGGAASYGTITLNLGKDFDDFGLFSYYESAGASFFNANRSAFTLAQIPQALPSLGSCLVYPLSSAARRVAFGATPFDATPLDAGAVLNLSGPKGTRQLLLSENGTYFAALAQGSTEIQYLVPGTYTVDNGAGGRDIGAFRATLVIPPPFTSEIQRSATAASVTWQGGDPAGYVTIDGSSSSPVAGPLGSFVCTERVSAGRFTVPAVVLQSLPAGVSVSVSHAARNRFQAPGLEVGQFSLFLALQ